MIHALIVGALILVPSLWLAPPPLWRLAPPQLAAIAAFAVAYLAAVFILRASGELRPRLSRVIFIGTAVFSACFTLVILLMWVVPGIVPPDFPRAALATSLLGGLAAFGLVHLARPGSPVTLAIASIAMLAGVAGHAAYRMQWLPRPVVPSRTVTHVDSSLYQLKITAYANGLPRPSRNGGGISRWGSGYLLATGDGELYLFHENEAHDSLVIDRLPRTVPLNVAEFKAGAHEIFSRSPRNYVESSRFRVADVLVQEKGDVVRLLASHHFWHSDRKCFVMRVSALEGTRQQLLDAGTSLEWRTLYETSPCLALNTEGPRGVRFEGLENGGRMAALSENELLLSVGDHGFDGVNRPEILAQDTTSSYGKVMRVSLDTGDARVFSLGHRNPQGLFIDANGSIWETEHGPRGGDELNLIRESGNYGWPIVSYGTEYSRHSWPLNAAQGRHTSFERPMLAFVPSVAVSSLTSVASERFPLWQGDLLVASLRAGAIWRVRIAEGRAIFAEPILVSRPIRDIVMSRSGRVILWTDTNELLFIEPASSQSGDALIAQCTGCHGTDVWEASFVAPSLAEVVGRPVASKRDFVYSDAMKSFGGRWTRKRLDAFLADPQAVVPGTKMQFEGIKDAAQRAHLVDYLERGASE